MFVVMNPADNSVLGAGETKDEAINDAEAKFKDQESVNPERFKQKLKASSLITSLRQYKSAKNRAVLVLMRCSNRLYINLFQGKKIPMKIKEKKIKHAYEYTKLEDDD